MGKGGGGEGGLSLRWREVLVLSDKFGSNLGHFREGKFGRLRNGWKGVRKLIIFLLM